MESNYEESINSNYEQVDQEDQENNNDDIGVGRSYVCVFCKRGFNTAQALGGHMNIHRKDRVRNKAVKQQEINTGPRFYQPLLQGDHHQSYSYAISHDHPLMSYMTYFHWPNSSTTLPLSRNNCHQYQQPLNPGYRSLGFAPKDLEMNQIKELDLELMLGYDS